MDKLKFETPDMVSGNIDRIAELFPSAITEMRGEDGEVKRGINFEVLKQLLSRDVVDGDECYEFTWVGKKAAMAEAARPITKTLRPVKEASRDWDTTENLYIEGDNLEVLKLLQESYLGKVKMIYIDPPYNTGHDFVYPDSFVMDNDEYNAGTGYFNEDGSINYNRENSAAGGRYHSDWCSMIYSRLLLARNFLAPDGVIYISIDYNENYNMRKMLDEVFGQSSFVGEIYWEAKTKSQNTITSYNKLQPKAEMIFVYSRQEKRRFNLIKRGEKEYPLTDDKGKYREHILEVMNANGIRGRETMVFDISDGISTVSLPEGKQWQLGQEQVAAYKEAGDLLIRDNKVIIKMRPEYERVETTEPFWGFYTKDLGTAESAKKELKEIMGPHGFETVKPVEIIKRLAYHATNSNDTILDFFSGSATTAHAVMQLNAEDGGHRRFIMVQLPEKCDEASEAYKAGYKNICEIGKERIRRAGDKIKAEHPDAQLDTGFRVFRVDESNIEDVYYHPEELTQTMLGGMVSNIKSDRSDLDLLYACLLDWGVEINLPHSAETLDGCTIHNVDDGALVACFNENVPDTVIRRMADLHPLRAVFRDSSFASDDSKINVTEIFKNLSPDTNVKVI